MARPRSIQVASVRHSRARLVTALAAATLAAACLGPAQSRPPDTSIGDVSVIVRATPGHLLDAVRAVTANGGRIGQSLSLINGFTALVPSSRLRTLISETPLAEVSPNAVVRMQSTGYDAHGDKASLFNLEDMIGARTMWNKWTGAGIDVALLDSGVAPVTGLAGPGQVLNAPDLTEESQNPQTAHLDTFGHGTQMAGIIAGHDPGVVPATNQGNGDVFMGMAPDARIVSIKVADARGMTDVSQVLAGLDWAVQHAHDPGMNIRVLNLSFGTDATQSYVLDPLAYAAEQAWKHGIVVVVSAGNTGNTGDGVTDPAIDPYVIAVGADNINGTPAIDDDTVAPFSASGDGVRNPDLLAPGTHVQSLRDPGSYVDATYASTGAIDGRYFRGSGTSQAAAIVSGAAALLIQEHPSYSPDQIKALLTSTALPLKNVPTSLQGAGLLNLRAASGPVSISGSQSFPASTGTGPVKLSRGSAQEVLHGTTLSGNTDIFGHSLNAARLAAKEAAGTAWSGGKWNGSVWSGSSWSGSSWSGSSWSGDDWSGSSWSSDNWSTGSWTGSSWSGSSWSGSSWSGSSWSGSSWSSNVWGTASWS